MSDQPQFPNVSRIADHTRYTPRHGGDGSGGEPPMSDLTARVEHLERDVGDIKLTLARMEGRLEAMDSKFDARLEAMDSKLGAMDSKLDSKLGAIDSKLDNFITWKSAFAGLAVLLAGLAGIAWWMVQQILTPILQASGAL